jgi:hypothetical protein
MAFFRPSRWTIIPWMMLRDAAPESKLAELRTRSPRLSETSFSATSRRACPSPDSEKRVSSTAAGGTSSTPGRSDMVLSFNFVLIVGSPFTTTRLLQSETDCQHRKGER